MNPLDLFESATASLGDHKVHECHGEEAAKRVDLVQRQTTNQTSPRHVAFALAQAPAQAPLPALPATTSLLVLPLTKPIIGPRPASVGWKRYGRVKVTAQAEIQNEVVPMDRCFWRLRPGIVSNSSVWRLLSHDRPAHPWTSRRHWRRVSVIFGRCTSARRGHSHNPCERTPGDVEREH